jgi:DNA-binding MarR family transcriptional regulator
VLPLVARLQRTTHVLLAHLVIDDLTPAEVNALACFGNDRAVTVSDLAHRAGTRRSTFTGVLDRLEQRGLVERRPHPDDRRSLLAKPTMRGRAVQRRVARAFAALERDIPAADSAAFDRVLHALEEATR